MKYKWLNKENNEKVIIFFNGWGMDNSAVEGLDFENYDVLMFYDYNSLGTNFCFEELKDYHSKFITAWSMGVMIATLFQKQLEPIVSATAINGTLFPIDIKYGIHPKIYDLTIKGFNEKGRERFLRSMFYPETDTLPKIKRTLENQKSELVALKGYQSNLEFKYNKIFISDNDKIIPTKSQVKYWNREPNLCGGHCVFNLFNKWEELL